MTVGSPAYLGGLAIVVLAFYALPRVARPSLIIGVTLAFYGSFSPWYPGLLLLVAGLSYVGGRRLGRTVELGRRGAMLCVYVACLVSTLALFKYAGAAARAWGSTETLLSRIILPIGLSFYTFQAIGYLCDVYRQKSPPFTRFSECAVFFAFFPNLLSGPIERARRIVPQWHADAARAGMADDRFSAGAWLIGWGLFKKFAVATHLGEIVDPIFASVEGRGGYELLGAVVAYALQIYCDFSGYTDIALGSARLLGIRLGPNFQQPYFSVSLAEYWRRWHISLSSWLNDYLFAPLSIGLRDAGKIGVTVALLLTFLISGLWHGERWTFVCWGLVHGGWLVVEMLTKPQRTRWKRTVGEPLFRLCGRIITLTVVGVGYVFFRADSMDDAFYILTHLGEVGTEAPIVLGRLRPLYLLGVLAVVFAVDYYEYQGRSVHDELRQYPLWVRWAAYYAGAAVVFFFGRFDAPSFIYFNF